MNLNHKKMELIKNICILILIINHINLIFIFTLN
jgi:hypothetical protein